MNLRARAFFSCREKSTLFPLVCFFVVSGAARGPPARESWRCWSGVWRTVASSTRPCARRRRVKATSRSSSGRDRRCIRFSPHPSIFDFSSVLLRVGIAAASAQTDGCLSAFSDPSTFALTSCVLRTADCYVCLWRRRRNGLVLFIWRRNIKCGDTPSQLGCHLLLKDFRPHLRGSNFARFSDARVVGAVEADSPFSRTSYSRRSGVGQLRHVDRSFSHFHRRVDGPSVAPVKLPLDLSTLVSSPRMPEESYFWHRTAAVE